MQAKDVTLLLSWKHQFQFAGYYIDKNKSLDIEKIQKKFKTIKTQNSFAGTCVWYKDLFEPSIFHSLLKYTIAMEYAGTLHPIVSIIKELKLNQKLWSKL